MADLAGNGSLKFPYKLPSKSGIVRLQWWQWDVGSNRYQFPVGSSIAFPTRRDVFEKGC